ncbi:MAG TPA: (5-formylfuran-3-yl)methyl phosphate synthase [Methylophilaceae bacterium]|nr:(5-formylfuran-3-yl)methyl phosphate synthase [Methylophilaceae bacterium]
MTQFLASVSNLDEAMLAMEMGVDIIDLKNPIKGALGALSPEAIHDIVAAIDGRAILSATVGDLPMQPERIMFAVEHTSRLGIDIVKVGFFGASSHRECIAAMQAHASQGVRMVAVLFADQAPDFGLLSHLHDAGFNGVMLDTVTKDGRGLLDHLPPTRLAAFVELAEAYRFQVGLAGSLKIADIPVLAALKPDFLGFRGALCEKLERTRAMSKKSLKEVKMVLQESNKMHGYAGRA